MFNLFKKHKKIGNVYGSLKDKETCNCGKVLEYKKYLEIFKHEPKIMLHNLRSPDSYGRVEILLPGRKFITISICDGCGNIFLRNIIKIEKGQNKLGI